MEGLGTARRRCFGLMVALAMLAWVGLLGPAYARDIPDPGDTNPAHGTLQSDRQPSVPTPSAPAPLGTALEAGKPASGSPTDPMAPNPSMPGPPQTDQGASNNTGATPSNGTGTFPPVYHGWTYRDLIETGSQWATILLLIVNCGFLAMIYFQLRTAIRQGHSQILLELNKRWDGGDLSIIKEDLAAFFRSVHATAQKTNQTTPEAAESLLQQLKSHDASRYRDIMRFVEFLEMMGVAVKKKYIESDDIYELLGGLPLYGDIYFSMHARNIQQEHHNPNVYKNFLYLVDEMKRVEKTRLRCFSR